MADSAEWEAVFWDIGGVILNPDSVRRAHETFVAALVDELSLSVEPEQALETWREAVGDHFRERDGTEYRRAAEAYDRGVAAVAGAPVGTDRWRPLFDAALRDHVRPESSAVSTVRALASRGLHLGVVSDIDQREADLILETFDINGAFDSITTSEEVGRTKPDRRMFETALSKAGVRPRRALHVGDRYRHDVEGAAAAGLGTVAYGAEDGPAVDFRVTDLAEVVAIVDGGDAEQKR